jgi:hypothetical protein
MNCRFSISVKKNGNTPPQCKLPREVPRKDIVRGYRTIYYDSYGNVNKEIIYPKEYHLKQIEENDVLELELIELKNNFPDWAVIEVF